MSLMLQKSKKNKAYLTIIMDLLLKYSAQKNLERCRRERSEAG